MATYLDRITGADKSSNNFGVAGTDLGIPYSTGNGRICMLFGDTFSSPFPGGPDEAPGSGANWRSPTILTTATPHTSPQVFDYAVGGGTWAKEAFYNAHNRAGTWNPLTEFTVIPNDGILIPETGRQIVSWMSMNRWDRADGSLGGDFRSGYASLAYSDNGQDWYRVSNLGWWNNRENTDPFQMWSMHREGDFIYIISVRAGRQNGPMMLRRVHYMHMFDQSWYEGWGWNGTNWGWGRPCTPILNGTFGEPSLRKIGNKWVMAYVNYAHPLHGAALVTRTASAIDGAWSSEKVQVTIAAEPNLYGGFIDPRSTLAVDGLTMYVSRWSKDGANRSTHYHVSQYRGTA